MNDARKIKNDFNKCKSNGRGKLTIFLGAVPGVGKTYAMLEAAQSRLAQGVDVVIGLIETHGRKETEILLNSIPIISPNKVIIKGKAANEVNLDAIINRHPQLVLIDDLAHANLPNSRHAHRYQDIEELLQSGINVYTTLNIEHVESINDIVAQITGVRVEETVPDRLLDLADQIKLIDTSPEELLQRFNEGRIFIPQDQKGTYLEFFKIGNINALRELALRYTAQRVDKQLDDYRKNNAIQGPCPAGEKIMACVSSSPFSTQVIRTARRMAVGLKSDWIAAYVETPDKSPSNEKEKEQLARNLRLAEELGAEVINLTGNEVAQELINLAASKNVTQIVIGKPLHSRFRDLWQNSVVDKIIRGSQNISIHVIPSKSKASKKKGLKLKPDFLDKPILPYFWTLLLVVMITFLNVFLGVDLINIALLYLLPVLFSAVYWGKGPSIMASLLGVLSFDVFFVPPFFSITVDDLRYLLSFVIFLLVAVITGTFATKLRNQAVVSRKRETRTAALYALSKKIVVETDIEGMLNAVVKVVAETIDGEAVVFMPDKKGNLMVKATTILPADKLLDLSENRVVKWVYEHGYLAGNGTETLGDAYGLYLPLKSEDKTVGVLGIKSSNPDRYLSSDQRRLLEAFTNLSALAIERLQLAAEAQQARYLIQSEKLRTALFNSISHELRTPLSTIMGAVTSLLDEDEIYSPADRKSLLQTVNEGALRMNRLVGNLLDMARLESGMMQLKLEWCDLQEIIGVALRRIQDLLDKRKLEVDIPVDLSLVKADFALIEQVIVNLLDNAIKYTAKQGEIFINVYQGERELKVTIADNGAGIPEIDREKIFDKFYRLYHPQQVTGTGLGLSICKGIIEAHGGKIWVSARPDGGSIFNFSLPLNEKLSTLMPNSKVGVKDE